MEFTWFRPVVQLPPLGSSRVGENVMEKRFTWVNSDGVPKKPDWRQLKEVVPKRMSCQKRWNETIDKRDEYRKLVTEVGLEAARVGCVPRRVRPMKEGSALPLCRGSNGGSGGRCRETQTERKCREQEH